MITTAFGAPALQALRGAVEEAKGGDPLAPVTILCTDNIAAVTARRALARGVAGRGGVAAIDVTTVQRLAEHLLQATGTSARPVTSALLTALWRRELLRSPGCSRRSRSDPPPCVPSYGLTTNSARLRSRPCERSPRAATWVPT